MSIVSRYMQVLGDSVSYTFGNPPPNQLIFFVTSICNFRCETCFNWKNMNRADNDLKLDEIEKISKHFGTLNLLLLSGGEPFLRRDLKEVIKVFYDTNHMRKLHLPTNGYQPEKIEATMREIFSAMADLRVFMGISLDGMETVHDGLKAVKNAFANALETQRRMVKLEREVNNFHSSFYIVVNDKNIEDMEEIFTFITERFGADKIGFSPLRGNPRDAGLREPTPEQWKSVCDLYERFAPQLEGIKGYFVKNQRKFLRDINLQVLGCGSMTPLKCSAGKNICVLDADGNVRICELKEPLGNVRDNNYDIRKLLGNIGIHSCSCTHSCFLNATLDMSPVVFLRSVF